MATTVLQTKHQRTRIAKQQNVLQSESGLCPFSCKAMETVVLRIDFTKPFASPPHAMCTLEITSDPKATQVIVNHYLLSRNEKHLNYCISNDSPTDDVSGVLHWSVNQM